MVETKKRMDQRINEREELERQKRGWTTEDNHTP